MNKILLIGNDTNVVERVERLAQGAVPIAYPVQVEVVDGDSRFSIRRRRPSAVVLDFRSPTATTLSVFSNLNARRQKVPLLLHLTAQQISEHSWRDFFSATEAAQPFTEQTSESDFQKSLLRLLEQEHSHKRRVSSHPPAKATLNIQDSENEIWRTQNNRRIDLIYKQRDSSLTQEEEKELAGLQEIASQYLEKNHPLPFEHLKVWENAARAVMERRL